MGRSMRSVAEVCCCVVMTGELMIVDVSVLQLFSGIIDVAEV